MVQYYVLSLTISMYTRLRYRWDSERHIARGNAEVQKVIHVHVSS